MTSIKDWSIDEIMCKTDLYIDNVLTYISGFIMRSMISKETCTLCYTYLTESKSRVTCTLINVKQLGGLIYPIADVVHVVTLANRNVKLGDLLNFRSLKGESSKIFILSFTSSISFSLSHVRCGGTI